MLMLICLYVCISFVQDSSIYGSVEGYVIVFSIDERTTFDSAIDILYNLRKDERKENAIILVGNKCDLVRTRNVMLEGLYLNIASSNY